MSSGHSFSEKILAKIHFRVQTRYNIGDVNKCMCGCFAGISYVTEALAFITIKLPQSLLYCKLCTRLTRVILIELTKAVDTVYVENVKVCRRVAEFVVTNGRAAKGTV